LCLQCFSTRVSYPDRTLPQQAITVAGWGLLLPALHTGTGFTNLAKVQDELRLTIIAAPICSVAMNVIKCSIAITLLRIQRQLWWRIFLWSILATLVVTATANFIWWFFQCKPVEAFWDLFGFKTHCVSSEVIRITIWVYSAFNIATDILLSLAPLAFLRNLNRPLKERVFICILMGAGLIVSAASIAKTVAVQTFNRDDPSSDGAELGAYIAVWTMVELQLALMAACLPAMKRPLQGVLKRFGVDLTTKTPSSYRAGSGKQSHQISNTYYTHGSMDKPGVEIQMSPIEKGRSTLSTKSLVTSSHSAHSHRGYEEV
jgi:hypothetical protein